jgi:integrase
MPLTDVAIKKLLPREKAYRVADGKGLALLVHPNGSCYWQLRFRLAGKAKIHSLGVYPDITLKEARELATTARKQIAQGIDPVSERRRVRALLDGTAANAFETIAQEWYGKEAPAWSESHRERTLMILERDLFPYVGRRVAREIKPVDLLRALRVIEERGAIDLAHKAKVVASQVMRYAIATERAERDPTADLKGALITAAGGHLAAITDPKGLGVLLQAMHAFKGTPVVKAALQLTPLLFVRPGELRQMEWDQLDFEVAEWRFNASKTGKPHIVPLARQALDILNGVRPLTARSRYVFPSARGARRPMSENAVLGALRALGFEKDQMTAHGFRATARTLLDEVLQERVDLIEHQLAHIVRDPLGRAYNRTTHLEARRAMMQRWADYLDSLRAAASA